MTTNEWEVRKTQEKEKRQERGKSAPFQIENVADDHPFFSFFHVRGASHLSYDVEIHSLLDDGKNSCTCPDYRYNGLGTCKHVEAVLEHLRKASPQAFTWTCQKQPELLNAVYTRWIEGTERLCLVGAESLTEQEVEQFFPAGVLSDAYEIDSPDVLELLDRLRKERVFFSRSAEATLHRLTDDAELYRKVLIRERDSLDSNVLRKPLKEYQVDSARFLLENRRCILSEPFGTGKRIAALAALAVIKKVRGNARVVVVTDSNYFSHWKRLIKIFYPLGVHTFGEALQRNAPDPFAVKPFFLCSY
ncbi:SWIM zinc finger domain-containing protein, partial [Myxococcota bacterium]|nr:SWIM zinc finger domain-containing protein [Myxococcota bacterium]